MTSAQPFSDSEFAAIQAEFPYLGHRAYLNHAAVGPLPLRGRKVIDDFNDTVQRMDRNFDPHTDEAILRSRQAFADLLGGGAEDIGLVSSTSAGINWALQACKLGQSDAILITDHEFPALTYASLNQKRLGVEIVIQPVEPTTGLQPEQLESAFQKHPGIKVVAVSWVSFHNGYRHDLKALADIAHSHGAYLLADIIQGLGTRPLDAPAMGIDIATASVHKWLLCPVGLGFVWCHPGIQAELDTPWGGWLSIDWHSNYSDLFGTGHAMSTGPRRAEVGTINFAGVRATAAVVSWIRDLGPDRIAAHTQSLLDYVSQQIDPNHFTVVSDRTPEHRSSILCIRPVAGDADRLRKHLAAANIACAVREGAVRLSPHFRTARSEVEHLVQSLTEFR